MSNEREPPTDPPEEDARETTRSQGQQPTAEGAPLVTEEGVDEGTADLVEEGRSRPAD
jgi:hypothetical protein